MGETTGLAAIISAVTSLVGGAVSWAGSYLGMITSNTTLMLFCIAIPLVGLGIGVIRRLTKIRA